MRKIDDLTGRQFGLLTVLEFSHRERDKTGNSRVLWNCKCECGREINLPGGDIKKSISCGCWKKRGRPIDSLSAKKIPEYPVWSAMIRRCTNQTDKNYRYRD